MSAIAGIVNFNKEPIHIEEIQNVMKSLEKFPANDIQVWQNENVFLGCHAQWITPESIGEPLPFYDSERQCTITADAIIDNREELFERLQVDRGKRKIMPDSQLILLAYYKWGEDTPKYLVGDFAFMIWDEREKKLFGARDFSGSRTLYYYHDQNHFAFCTVMMPLFKLPYIKKELNEEWLAEFLAISSVIDTVDTSTTVYQRVLQVPPSHSITIKEGRISLSRYCTIIQGEKLQLKSDQEYIEAFQDVFQVAVTSRIRTHRNVGAHLSGGLDSGSIVGFAAKALKKEHKQLQTYSYVPPNDFDDFTPKSRIANEKEYIHATAEYVGDIKENLFDFAGSNPYLEINNFLETMEMPYKFFENSVWLKGIYETAHKDDLGILLNGGRGNLTISWGPALEYYATLLKKIKIHRLFYEIGPYSKNTGMKKSQILSYIGKIAFPLVNRISPLFEPINSTILVNPELAKRTNVFEKLKNHGIDVDRSSLPDLYEERKRHFGELFHWSATNTLGTKLSLQYSLWKRDPTNDLRVVRFCLSVPEEQYVQNGIDRALIRRSTKDILPDKVRLNQRVRGVQGVDWVHRMTPTWDLFIDELQKLKEDKSIFNYLNSQVVKNAISKVEEGPRAGYAINGDYRIAIRSLIVYRFIKSMT
ncbi:lasso peptide isopeptide bond-forming cyclase [Bacillus sp. V3B]|uniref:lasso peptide isopeptide bond-forming cyclase n=1 Tax=Bacillus sp. V3B TaxID=2804915 RepID=UPI00210C8E11|nr:lasso peptide isopeptide bond-forming cyclase [Bacillus sp. V3B]MCQ6275265.1 lasso peptide isopeptide bond-forming cyclase [Bacillus sp. V3B]